MDTGRKCEGPLTPQIRFDGDHDVKSIRSVLLPDVEIFATRRSDDERWAFNYFLHRVAPIYAGVVDGDFWLDLVPRLAQYHEFVWDVVVSSSCMFEHLQYNKLETTYDPNHNNIVQNDEHRKALKWYNRAIIGFRQMLKQGEADNGYILLSCLLFGTLEFQQRNVGSGMRLLNNAYTIVAQNLFASPKQEPLLIHYNLQELTTTFLSRKAVLMGPLGRPIPLAWHLQDGQTLKPSTRVYLTMLKDVKAQLDTITYQSYEIVRVGHLLCNDDYEMEKLKPKQQSCLRVLQQWQKNFLTLFGDEEDPGIRCILSTLLMYWNMSYIWLSAATSPFETSFDEHMAAFRDLTYNTEVVLQYLTETETGTELLISDADVIPPLFFTATKCRDPLLRRRALSLLRKAPQQREFWASIMAPSVIETVIAVEEGAASPSDNLAPSLQRSLPPEERRVHHVAIVKGEVSQGCRHLKIRVSKAAYDSGGSMMLVNEDMWVEECTEALA